MAQWKLCIGAIIHVIKVPYHQINTMKKILVIEDEVLIRNNVKTILELSGYEVMTAADGLVGLETAKTHLPDLIVCDLMLPLLDGYGVLEALRENDTTAMIPLIFLTAKAEHSNVRQGMELGADDYLTKPFESSELLKAISTRLERKEKINQQYIEQYTQNKNLEKEVNSIHKKLESSQQVSEIQTDLLQKLIQDLRNPLSNINMAIHMLKQAKSEKDRERYLKILQEECACEIKLLNEIEYLQQLITPENAKLLQKWKLTK